MHELPANHQAVALVGEHDQLQKAVKFLEVKGYKISDSFLSDETFWKQIREQQLSECNSNSVQLWRANPLLFGIIKIVENAVSGRKAIDVACGAGRDSVYLAQRGWQVISIDNKTDALDRCQRLALSSKVILETSLRDLENQARPLADLSADLVLVMRYLHRPLFSSIDDLINPGGAIIYSTFMVGSEKYGSPRNPAYLLKPGELAEIFSGYRILIDEQHNLIDGRPVALFVALKPEVTV
jgi:SAM-dependent methyltransferase